MQLQRSRKALTIAETAASMAFLVPIIVLLIFAVIEVSQAYHIHNGLSDAARRAARDLAAAYAQSSRVVGDRSLQNSLVYDRIRIQNVINSSEQFGEATFDEGADPPTVTVVVRYTGEETGLPKFPDPDPINLGASLNLQATATYRLD